MESVSSVACIQSLNQSRMQFNNPLIYGGKGAKNIHCRFSPVIVIRVRTFHRRDAEEIQFAQSGDDDWANIYSSNLRIFLFVVVSDKQKVRSLCPCGIICISSFVYFASFVVKRFVTTKSTKVTKFGSLFVPGTQRSQRLFCALRGLTLLTSLSLSKGGSRRTRVIFLSI